MKAKSSHSYWDGNGNHQHTSKILHAMLPKFGEVEDGNPALETFRVASNCYRDLYNNGLCNRANEFKETFGFLPDSYTEDEGCSDLPIIPKLERKMDRIIIAAAKEQGV